MNKLLSSYKNGNYTVKLYEDGTKEKFTYDDQFIADFPDSIDLKITNFCDANCPMCHENSSVKGKHANLNLPIIKSLPSGIELAIGGGNPLSHPNLIPFLKELKKAGVICNITVNERHLIADNALIDQLISEKLVWGVGVSINDCNPKTIDFLHKNVNSVAHLICGIVNANTLKKLYDCKILILGYKQKGRGKEFYSDSVKNNIFALKKVLPLLFDKYQSISFDNLALEQLKVEKMVCKTAFNKAFFGSDGEGSMYIDLVNQTFAVSSTSETVYPLANDLKQVFNVVKTVK